MYLDHDLRAAQITAINLGLNGLYGWAVWQNTLTLECHRVYKIGMHLRGPRPGVILDVPVDNSPFSQVAVAASLSKPETESSTRKTNPDSTRRDEPPEADGDLRQLDLF